MATSDRVIDEPGESLVFGYIKKEYRHSQDHLVMVQLGQSWWPEWGLVILGLFLRYLHYLRREFSSS